MNSEQQPESICRWPTRNIRDQRVLRALSLHIDGIKRERLNAIAGASNSPGVASPISSGNAAG